MDDLDVPPQATTFQIRLAVSAEMSELVLRAGAPVGISQATNNAKVLLIAAQAAQEGMKRKRARFD